MREICASGSVGGEGGNALAYPAGDKLPSAAIVHGRSAHFGERISGPQLGKRPTLPVGFRTFMQNANLRARPGSPGARGEGQHGKEDQ